MSADRGITESEAFSDFVRHIAERLRRLADDVEREADVKNDLSTLLLDHARSAGEVVHKVAWGVANLRLGDLVAEAAAADRAQIDE